MKRRHFLTTSVLGTLPFYRTAADDLSVYSPPDSETIRVSILHTTDLHGHIRPTQSYDGATNVGGFARCMSQIRQWRKANKNSITLDVGDLYQGTHVSLETEGELMIELLNQCRYDAWVAGNHDFDWGERVFRKAVQQSNMPVLSANLQADGFSSGHKHHQSGDYAGLLPTMIKQIDGIKIGIFGLTTPGLPFWLNPSQLGSIQALDPLDSAKRAIATLKSNGVHCIIAAGHMGLKSTRGRRDEDDYANQVNRIIKACPEIDVYIAGHTHRERPSSMIGNTLFTQSGYHGIWTGNLELTFSGETKQLIRRNANTAKMNASVEEDPVVLSIAKDELELSTAELRKPVGKLKVQLTESEYGQPAQADSQSLICAAIMHTIRSIGAKLDGVLHPSFTQDPIQKGEKTIADLWELIPYENRIVTAQLTGEQLQAVIEESFNNTYYRRRDNKGWTGAKRLYGFEIESKWNREKRSREIISIHQSGGKRVDPKRVYHIAFNSYQAQSGGRRYLLLREILLKASSKTNYHPIDTRTALADFFLEKGEIDSADLRPRGSS